MTSFDITLYGQGCRRHVVGQRFLSAINVVRISYIVVEASVACFLYLIMLIC